jgi:Na+/H+ antiporter NhaD/arsenite permease-like protein
LWFAGLIIIAANAGGAWSPIGDVTTTMLWMGKKVSTIKLIKLLIIPSLIMYDDSYNYCKFFKTI